MLLCVVWVDVPRMLLQVIFHYTYTPSICAYTNTLDLTWEYCYNVCFSSIDYYKNIRTVFSAANKLAKTVNHIKPSHLFFILGVNSTHSNSCYWGSISNVIIYILWAISCTSRHNCQVQCPHSLFEIKTPYIPKIWLFAYITWYSHSFPHSYKQRLENIFRMIIHQTHEIKMHASWCRFQATPVDFKKYSLIFGHIMFFAFHRISDLY